MVSFEIPKGSPWHQLRVMDAAVKYGNHFLVCILERDGEVLIPSGNTVLMEGDKISMIAPTEAMNTCLLYTSSPWGPALPKPLSALPPVWPEAMNWP